MRESLLNRPVILIGAGWLFAWLMLEMVFFGEPLFKYASSSTGFLLYYVAICTVALAAVILSGVALRRSGFEKSRMLTVVCGVVGSAALVIVRASAIAGPSVLPWMPCLVICAVAFGVCATCLLGSFARVTMEVVFTRGLRSTLCAVLVGIALSFLLLPRFLRDGIYGETLTALSPLVVAATMVLLGCNRASGACDSADVGNTDDKRARRSTITGLIELALLSFLMYLVSYFDYVIGSVQVVVDENTYLYVTVLVMIAVLIAALLLARTERQLTTSFLLLLLFGIMVVTLVAFFGILSYVVYQGDYVYPLTKLLRRVVKIGMLFTLVITLYQSSLKAVPAFLGVIVLPLVCGKLVQLSIATWPMLNGLVAQHRYPYLASIGFVAIVLWSLALTTCVRNSALLNSQALEGNQEGQAPADPSPTSRIDAMARTYNLTEREKDVLVYLAGGNSLKAIAGKLCVSQNTVKTHVMGLYRKTGAHARQDIIDLLHDDAAQ